MDETSVAIAQSRAAVEAINDPQLALIASSFLNNIEFDKATNGSRLATTKVDQVERLDYSTTCNWIMALAALDTRLTGLERALEAERFEFVVKPLEWKDHNDGFLAKTPFGLDYHIKGDTLFYGCLELETGKDEYQLKGHAQGDFTTRLCKATNIARSPFRTDPLSQVKPGDLERIVWSAMSWVTAQWEYPPTPYTDNGNSHAELQCRATVKKIRDVITKGNAPQTDADALSKAGEDA